MFNAPEYFEMLGNMMHTKHTSLNRTTNPVAMGLRTINTQSLTTILEQYSVFPRHIVCLLELGRNTLRGWNAVHQELARNIDEELGSRTDGISHYDLLRRGMSEEYGLQIDNVRPQSATSTFLLACDEALRNPFQCLEFSAGALYAIEATSTSEIRIVCDIADELSARLYGRPLPRESTAWHFLESHLEDFEPGHEEGLRSTMTPYLEQGNVDAFSQGFEKIIVEMDQWWEGLFVAGCAIKAPEVAFSIHQRALGEIGL